jgi:hypothetical protein
MSDGVFVINANLRSWWSNRGRGNVGASMIPCRALEGVHVRAFENAGEQHHTRSSGSRRWSSHDDRELESVRASVLVDGRLQVESFECESVSELAELVDERSRTWVPSVRRTRLQVRVTSRTPVRLSACRCIGVVERIATVYSVWRVPRDTVA